MSDAYEYGLELFFKPRMCNLNKKASKTNRLFRMIDGYNGWLNYYSSGLEDRHVGWLGYER